MKRAKPDEVYSPAFQRNKITNNLINFGSFKNLLYGFRFYQSIQLYALAKLIKMQLVTSLKHTSKSYL